MKGKWSSIRCHEMRTGCKLSQVRFRTVVAHDMAQVSMGCLSTGYTAALFSAKHSAGPE
jgi:hypothetical protein